MFLGTTILLYVADWFCFMTRTNNIQKNRMKDFSITNTATKLLLWRHKMWCHQYFHHLFCCSKVENENSKTIQFLETLNTIFQQNIIFLGQKLEKNYQGVWFLKKSMVGLVSGGSLFFSSNCHNSSTFWDNKERFSVFNSSCQVHWNGTSFCLKN